jgi:hypothetical protein
MARALLIETAHYYHIFASAAQCSATLAASPCPILVSLLGNFLTKKLHHRIISNRQTSTPRAWRAADQTKLQSSTPPREFRRSARISYARRYAGVQ